MWRGLVASGMVDLVLETTHVEAAGDLAVGTGTARATVQSAGAGTMILEGRYTVVFRRQVRGEWRTIVDMYTIDSERPAHS
jgi:ketosteroid isomerase-like protein